MQPRLTAFLAILLIVAPFGVEAAGTRIKDIVDIEGVRENQLVGYGLVVGLNGTGDSLDSAPFTEQSLIGMLERLGVSVRGQDLDTDNVAAVMVTATLPPFSAQGSKIDVGVSALGDADDLAGGTLLVTPLLGADGEVYAVAQGPVATAAVSAQGEAGSITRGVPTNGRIANGAIIERELPFDFSKLPKISLALRNPDFTTSMRIAMAINRALGGSVARAEDPATVHVSVPLEMRDDIVGLITRIEQLPVEADQPARVVIDEASGIIVIGADVRISRVAIAQGNLTISVNETPQVSQPNPLATQGQTAVVPRTDVELDDGSDRRLTVLDDAPTLEELVQNLNALGIGPRDMISILQAIKAAGALQADIEVM